MARWTAFPFDAAAYTYDLASLERNWARLHAGDAEPWPEVVAVQEAWMLFHAGQFQDAVAAGLRLGGAGLTVANWAQCVHANYLERSERNKLALYMDVAERAAQQAADQPGNPNAHFLAAYALGRYSQGISVTKALAQGLGGQIKGGLETAIKLQPSHADAHMALGTFHAEVIDTVGKLLAKTQGAEVGTGLRMFREALRLNPGSAIARVAYANGLVMLEGDSRQAEADRLYADAAACIPLDAKERLDVEMARAELDD